MILPIVTYNSSILRKYSAEVSKDQKDLSYIIDSLKETMLAVDGAGLAAPQIGYSLRMFTVNNINGDNEVTTFINPKILYQKGLQQSHEACLSIPEVDSVIHRDSVIHLEWFDVEFNIRYKTFRGVMANVIQHEFDHLNGRLFIDYLSSIERMSLQYKLNKIKNGKVKTEHETIIL